MDGAGHQFLAGAGFAGDQDRGAGGSDPRNLFAHVPNRRALAENLGGALQTHNRVLEQFVLAQQARAFPGASRRSPDYFRLERLGEEVEGPVPHTLDGQFDAGYGGQKNH
jgi:hypothetical protein